MDNVKVKTEAVSEELKSTVASGPGSAVPTTKANDIPEQKPLFSSRRVTGFHLKEHVGKSITAIGEVVDIDGTGTLLKITLTPDFLIMASSQLPLHGIKVKDLVEIEGLLEKANKLRITSLQKFDRTLFVDNEMLEINGPEVMTFDMSMYNEMVDLLHTHGEFINVKNKIEHFGTDDIANELSIPVIDLSYGTEEDAEDPCLGLAHHALEKEAVDHEIRKRIKEEAAMATEFTDSGSESSVQIVGTASGSKA